MMKDIIVQTTPNPSTLQFIFPKKMTDKALEFKNQNETNSPLLKTLLGFPWVKQVFVSQNFISLTKENWVEWESLKPSLLDLISEYKDQPLFPSTQPSVHQNSHSPSTGQEQNQNNFSPNPTQPSNQSKSHPPSNQQNPAQKIKQLIDTEIQPIVQMDGGAIQFSHYEDGNVYVRLQGACVGCPSAEWTLKQGVQKRIQQDFPEVKEVIAID